MLYNIYMYTSIKSINTTKKYKPFNIGVRITSYLKQTPFIINFQRLMHKKSSIILYSKALIIIKIKLLQIKRNN